MQKTKTSNTLYSLQLILCSLWKKYIILSIIKIYISNLFYSLQILFLCFLPNDESVYQLFHYAHAHHYTVEKSITISPIC